jgi:hypothetical protein
MIKFITINTICKRSNITIKILDAGKFNLLGAIFCISIIHTRTKGATHHAR